MYNFYKLDLSDSKFWQGNEADGYKKDYFDESYLDEYNHIYFRRISNNSFVEVLTGNVLEIGRDGEVIKPLGVIINTDNLQECSVSLVVEAYKKIREAGLMREYDRVLKNFLIDSNSCFCAEIKRNLNISNLMHF